MNKNQEEQYFDESPEQELTSEDLEAKFNEFIGEKDYGSALYFAEENLPFMVERVASKALQQYIDDENYDAALDVAETYVPERAPEVAYLYLEERLDWYKHCALTHPLEEQCFESSGLSYDSLKEMSLDNTVREVASEYLSPQGNIIYYTEDGYKAGFVDVEARIAEFQGIEKEKSKNYELFKLKKSLAERLTDENYSSAARIKEDILCIDENALTDFQPERYIDPIKI